MWAVINEFIKPPNPAAAHLLENGLRLWYAEGYQQQEFSGPYDSVAGARYRDGLQNHQYAKEALKRLAFVISQITTHARYDEKCHAEAMEYLFLEYEGRCLYPRFKNYLKTHPFEESIIAPWLDYRRPLTIPEAIRTQHHHIVAGTGQGKSECIKNLVMQDVENGHSVVVVDSQNDLINDLAVRIPEKLILVDPVHCPPALNLFQADTSSELFEYIFAALDAQMTAKQATAYRFVSRMVVLAGGNIHLMRRILEPGNEWQQYAHLLTDTARSFFETEYSSRQFADTRQQILRRLYQVLENETMDAMLGATDNRLNIADAINTGQVVLISTAKDHLKQLGASLFGRIFIAQVMQAAMERKGKRKRTYLYLDEFQDYAEDSHVLFNLFEQARKYELGLIVAHQYLGQLPTQLQQSLAANTAIKFAGGVSAEDARKLASQMHTDANFILSQPKGTFAMHVRGDAAGTYPVELGKLARTKPVREISAIREEMRERFGPLPHQEDPPKEPYSRPSGEWGSGEVPETGEW